MKRIKYFYFALISLALFSCYEDKGNYEYTEFQDVQIEGLEEMYSVVSRVTRLEISPKIENEESYNYLWHLYLSDGVTLPLDTIGNSKNLSTVLDLEKGNYTIFFEVTDKKTEYKRMFSTKLTVNTASSSGFYILKDQNGMGDMDLLNGETFIENVLMTWQGSKLKGTPTRLSILASYSYFDKTGKVKNYQPVIIPFTAEDARIINLGDFSTIYSYDNFYYFPSVTPITPYHMLQVGSMFTAFITSDGIYHLNLMSPAGSGQFGYPLSIDKGVEPAPYHLMCSHTGGIAVYDNKNGRFLNINYNGGFSEFTDGIDDVYKSKGLDYNLIYIGAFNDEGTAVMESKDKSERYILSLAYDRTVATVQTNPVVSDKSYKLADASLLNQAKVYGHSYSVNYLYYSTGNNKVHIYDIPNRNDILDIATFPADEEVTFVRNIYWQNANDVDNNFNYLVIATHKAGKYKVYMYETLAGRPDAEKEPKIISGDGKVVGVQYASSLMGRNVSSRSFYSFD